MPNEWDIDGAVETEGGVEYDTGGVVERDAEGGVTYIYQPRGLLMGVYGPRVIEVS